MTVDKLEPVRRQTQAGEHAPHNGRRLAGFLTTAALALTLVGIVPAPANAGVRFFLGLGLPFYPAYPAYPAYPSVAAPYPYAYSYPYPPAATVYGGYGVIAPPVVIAPHAWVGSHWGWRHDRWGHRHRVWVRGHRR